MGLLGGKYNENTSNKSDVLGDGRPPPPKKKKRIQDLLHQKQGKSSRGGEKNQGNKRKKDNKSEIIRSISLPVSCRRNRGWLGGGESRVL